MKMEDARETRQIIVDFELQISGVKAKHEYR